MLYVLVISEEPKPAKKLMVSLILRKAKMAVAEKTVDRIIEIIRRTVAFFLNNARKRLIAVRRIVAAMATTRYLVGRISRRNIPTNNAMKEMMAMQTQMRAIRLRRFLPEVSILAFFNFVLARLELVFGFSSGSGKGSKFGSISVCVAVDSENGSFSNCSGVVDCGASAEMGSSSVCFKIVCCNVSNEVDSLDNCFVVDLDIMLNGVFWGAEFSFVCCGSKSDLMDDETSWINSNEGFSFEKLLTFCLVFWAEDLRIFLVLFSGAVLAGRFVGFEEFVFLVLVLDLVGLFTFGLVDGFIINDSVAVVFGAIDCGVIFLEDTEGSALGFFLKESIVLSINNIIACKTQNSH